MIVPTSYNVSHVADIELKGGGSNIKQYREVSDLVCHLNDGLNSVELESN